MLQSKSSPIVPESGRLVLALVGAVLAAMVLGSGSAAEQEREHHGPAIVSPADGAVVTNPVTVAGGFNRAEAGGGGGERMAGPEPQGQEHPGHGGHLVLFIDAPPLEPGVAVPADAAHVAFPDGQRQVTVTLTPGTHHFRLVGVDRDGLVGRHRHASEEITVEVR